jgi:hypothetical protein
MLSGDSEFLEDFENVSKYSHRVSMPDIPELPDIELKFEEVMDGQEANEGRSD